MPWIDSKKIVPPINKEVMVKDKNGIVRIREIKDIEVYDGRGGFNPDIPPYWQRVGGDPDSPLPQQNRGCDGISCRDQHVDIDPTFKKEGE